MDGHINKIHVTGNGRAVHVKFNLHLKFPLPSTTKGSSLQSLLGREQNGFELV
jgi:hypothetical protein